MPRHISHTSPPSRCAPLAAAVTAWKLQLETRTHAHVRMCADLEYLDVVRTSGRIRSCL